MILTDSLRGLHYRHQRGAHQCTLRIALLHRHLCRVVRDEAILRSPVHRPVARDHLPDHVVAAKRDRIAPAFRLSEVFGKPCAELYERLVADGLRIERLDRIGGCGIPVLVEGRGRITHDGAQHREVEIDEVHLLVRAEVFVSDIAAADDRDTVVSNPALVVHAAVDTLEIHRAFTRFAQAAASRNPRIEHPHLDVRVGRERRIAVVLRARVEVVDVEPYAHATIRGLEELLREIDSGEVGVPDVRLDVQAPRREPRALHAHDEGFGALGRQVKCRLARMTGLGGCNKIVQGPSFGRRDGRRIGQRRTGRQLRAAADRGQRQNAQEAPVHRAACANLSAFPALLVSDSD